jgi:hypothetical protein
MLLHGGRRKSGRGKIVREREMRTEEGEGGEHTIEALPAHR